MFVPNIFQKYSTLSARLPVRRGIGNVAERLFSVIRVGPCRWQFFPAMVDVTNGRLVFFGNFFFFVAFVLLFSCISRRKAISSYLSTLRYPKIKPEIQRSHHSIVGRQSCAVCERSEVVDRCPKNSIQVVTEKTSEKL